MDKRGKAMDNQDIGSLAFYLQLLRYQIAVLGDAEDRRQVRGLFVGREEIEPGDAVSVGQEVGAPAKGGSLLRGRGGPLSVGDRDREVDQPNIALGI